MSLPPASLFVRGFGYAALAVAMTAVAGCASHPKPAPAAVAQAAPPPSRPAPAPYHEPAPSVSTAPLPGSERDFVVNVGDRVYFDYNKFNVRSDAEALLAAQASWLQRYPAVQVRIEGNCDERGTEQYNLALGARRANAVKAFLISHGVADGRISTVSYGKEKPIDTGEGEQAWEHNRNGHTAILSGAR
ncbi:MAG TPA: peptidoglycan-associated lipoprotein Pal [Phenylobacterium sp.]|jgi:peptidoglycan-associated lipoprotein|uniref:peptidoglycan-associated lipoprotein Pal n=1 Tax=Phenylobacterium sp. TaxID=1871053 RepID=UPI002D351684|nr:peptidoglycan-associated lipoprotein Pal [Phenylobacterium sp.]HZZ66923.1 peptidoglycan-associated lipoprotein Pal [Phenylobacterium sp.]